MGTGLELVGAVVSIAGGLMGAAAANRENKARQAMANVQQQNQRLDQVRAARIKQAQIIQAGANQGAGTTESSSVVTGASGAVGQAESNVAYIANQWNVSKSIFSAQRAQIQAKGIEDIGKGIFDVGQIDSQAAAAAAGGGG